MNLQVVPYMLSADFFMANPPLDEYHKVENWSNLKLI